MRVFRVILFILFLGTCHELEAQSPKHVVDTTEVYYGTSETEELEAYLFDIYEYERFVLNAVENHQSAVVKLHMSLILSEFAEELDGSDLSGEDALEKLDYFYMNIQNIYTYLEEYESALKSLDSQIDLVYKTYRTWIVIVDECAPVDKKLIEEGWDRFHTWLMTLPTLDLTDKSIYMEVEKVLRSHRQYLGIDAVKRVNLPKPRSGTVQG